MTEQELREYNRKEKERRVDEGYTYGQEAVEWGNDPNNMTDLGLKLHNLFNKSNRTNAHDNIDTLINQNENKDYFELMKGMMPSMDTVENFVPPIGAIKLLQLMNQPKGTEQAFMTGLKESVFGEPDPVGPQGMPFSQFMQQKKALNPQVKSIVNQHVNNLFKK